MFLFFSSSLRHWLVLQKSFISFCYLFIISNKVLHVVNLTNYNITKETSSNLPVCKFLIIVSKFLRPHNHKLRTKSIFQAIFCFDFYFFGYITFKRNLIYNIYLQTSNNFAIGHQINNTIIMQLISSALNLFVTFQKKSI